MFLSRSGLRAFTVLVLCGPMTVDCAAQSQPAQQSQASPPVLTLPTPSPLQSNKPGQTLPSPKQATAESLTLQVVRELHSNGQPKIERTAYRDGNGTLVDHGKWTMFGPNGARIGGGEMHHGKRHGHWDRLVEKSDSPLLQEEPLSAHPGPFLSEADFMDGEINGTWTIKSAQGTIVAAWGFLAGKQHGQWAWSRTSGKPEYRTVYVSGKQHGTAELYDANGKLVQTKSYFDGREIVRQVFRHPNGAVSCEGTFLTAREKLQTSYDWWKCHAETLFYGYVGGRDRHGKFVWYYPNGAKKTEGEYFLGQITGTWNYYNEDGTLQKTETVPPPDLPKDKPVAVGVAGATPNTTPTETPQVKTQGSPTSGLKASPTLEAAPVPQVTPVLKPSPGDKPIEKSNTPEPGIEQKTPVSPTVAQIGEVKAARLTRAPSPNDENVINKSPVTPAKKPLIQPTDD